MLKKLTLKMLVISAIVAPLVSCNGKAENDITETQYTNTAIASFALVDDDEILRNLSTVFFSIDLVKADIFNADSLPKGTDVSALAVTIGTSVLSKAELTYTDDNGMPVTIDYIADPTSKINFSHGPVALRVASYDGSAERTYAVKVNVHQVDADLMVWDVAEGGTGATNLTAPLLAIHSAVFAGKPATLSVDINGNTCLAFLADIISTQWQYVEPSLPAGYDIDTFCANDESLFIVADGKLYSSSDGVNWTYTSVDMTNVYGMYDNIVLGNRQDASGKYITVLYPGGDSTPLPDALPVKGMSNSIFYSYNWMDTAILTTVGGSLDDGSVSGATWGFDGTAWAQLSDGIIPPVKGILLVPYYTKRTSPTDWTSKMMITLIAFGGLLEDGTVNRTVYMSTDLGVHWRQAPSSMQLPDEMPSLYNGQPILCNITLNVDNPEPPFTGSWLTFDSVELPLWMQSNTTRDYDTYIPGVTPVTTWEVPYIFIPGFTNDEGKADAHLLRGVINYLKFKPLQ